ncbi:thiopeptide-type bacteriocin biosynthesis protein [Mucilaginibacter oryzae]|uniref:Thiopeptide-type bacteriocin biosynthesis protein n=1 Tax=Mucilaginibacter oryzae TaxID=468058 RepID=A0A316HG90_9SPHI|nr:lantibiotic dehydratase [Mucilaginibacter oryzae]PWK79598.1 thiopeptide-type bacteriocin biosynthesis protein [Mucilaginibacter oryzae]
MKVNFANGLILRSAALSYRQELDHNTLVALWHNPLIKESIYIASKSLYNELNAFFEGNEKASGKEVQLISSFYKYMARMGNRATPFGLFAGCAAVNWGTGNNITLTGRYRKHIAPDAVVSFELARQIEAANKLNAGYKINNTIYKVGDDIRFITYHVIDKERIYQVSAVDANPVIDNIIETVGNTIWSRQQLLDHFPEFDRDDLLEFINDLIDVQLLKPAFEPVIGFDFPLFIQQTDDLALNNTISELIGLLNGGDNYGSQPANWLSFYSRVEKLTSTITGRDLKDQIHITRFDQLESRIVNSALQAKIAKGITLLNNLCTPGLNKRLEQFKNRFRKRYEEQSVPLLEVFDTDTGIEYGQWYEHETLFTEGLYATGEAAGAQVEYTELDFKMLDLLNEAKAGRIYHITLPDNFAKQRGSDNLPFSMCAVFQLFENDVVFLERVTGPGALSMIARFATADEEIYKIGLEIAGKETENFPEAMFAEVIHMPEERILNVMSHPPFWPHELAYIDDAKGKSVLQLDDIYVKLEYNAFRLFSKKHQREVIPRLSSAYNYNRSQHPIYTFLCDIQHQYSNGGLAFNWGGLTKEFVFFPRVETAYGLILHRATWKFTPAILNELCRAEKQPARFSELLAAFREQWLLPDKFFIVKGDNELLVDVNNEIALAVFAKEIAKQSATLILTECIHLQYQSVVKGPCQQPHAHQLVAPFYFERPVKQAYFQYFENSLQRNFFPGSEWLFIKLYLSSNIANNIILRLNELLDHSGTVSIKQWFFIRYHDPDNHIRVRINLLKEDDFQDVYLAIREVLSPFLISGQVHVVQLDTYVRELERYGNQIEQAEGLFCIETLFCCKVFRLLETNRYDTEDWFLIFWLIKDYLNLMSGDINRQIKFVEKGLSYFLTEFDDKAVKIQIDQLFRKYHANLDNVLLAYDNLLQEKRQNIANLLQRYHVDWNDKFLSSVIHMAVNRYFSTRQRLHECILYGIMLKYLKSEKARNKL